MGVKIMRVKNHKEDIDKYVPHEYQAGALKEWKRKVEHLEAKLKATADEMEELKKEKDEDKNETKDEKKNEDSDETATALLARTDLHFRPLETEVDDLKHKIEHVKNRKHDIIKYCPKEYQANELKHWKRKVERLEAELKKAEDEMEAVKKAKAATSTNATSSKGPPSLSDMMAALVASDRSTGPAGDTSWVSVSVGFCATVSVLSLAVALRRRSVNVDQQPLLG